MRFIKNWERVSMSTVIRKDCKCNLKRMAFHINANCLFIQHTMENPWMQNIALIFFAKRIL